MLVYASLGGQSLQPGLANLMFRDVRLHGFWLSNWLERLSPDQLQEFVGAVMKLLATGIIQPRTADVFPLALVEQAIVRSQVFFEWRTESFRVLKFLQNHTCPNFFSPKTKLSMLVPNFGNSRPIFDLHKLVEKHNSNYSMTK